MFRRIGYALTALFRKDFLETVRSRRMVALSIVLGIAFLGSAWYLGQGAGRVGEPDGGAPPVWQQGADGALTALAFALIPLVLPVLPVSLVASSLKRDLSRGHFSLLTSKPVHVVGVVLGKAIGLLVPVVLLLVPLAFGSALLIQVFATSSVSLALVGGLVVASLAMAALYLVLALLVGSWLGPRNIAIVLLLVWIGFNLVTPTGFLLAAEIVGFRPPSGLPFFELTFIDTLTFTGLYNGLLASFVPAELGFVGWPDPSSPFGSVAPLILQSAALAWIAFLLAFTSVSSGRLPRS